MKKIFILWLFALCSLLLALNSWFLATLLFAEEPISFQRGLILANTGQYQSAIIELNKVIEMEPGHTTAYLVLGICYTETGEYDKAVQSLEKIKDKLPESEVLHYTLALLYEKEEKWREANLSWQKFLSLTGDKELKEIARKHLKQISEHLKE